MKKNCFIILILCTFLFTTSGCSAEEAANAGNKICPVTGESIGTMGKGTQVEYQGKIYNLCCPGCVAPFKKDPEKYIKIIEQEKAQQMETGEKDAHEGHQHIMGEMDGDMMAVTDEDHSMMEGQNENMMMDKAPVKEIKLEAYQFSYEPDTITVDKGDDIRIHATSRDVPHGIYIKEYGINEKVEKGKFTDIEFIADKAGEFDIICSVYCGKGHRNMRGKLIVKK